MANVLEMGLAKAKFKEQTNRQQRQDDLTAQMAGYELNQETGRYQAGENLQTTQDLKAQQLEATVQQLQSNATARQSADNARGVTDIVSNISSGNWADATNTWNNTPGLKDSFANTRLDVANIEPINFNDPFDMEQLKPMGITPDILENPEYRDALNRSFMKVTGQDGKKRLASTSQVIAQTNSYNMMNQDQKRKHNESARYINGVLSNMTAKPVEAAKTDIMVTALETGDPQEVMHAYMITNPEKFLGAGGSQRRDSLAQEVEAFGKGNPNATPKEWEAFYRRYSEKKDIGTGGRRESEDIIELSTEQKKAEKVSAVEPTKFNVAEARDTENKIFAKLDEKKKKSVQDDVDKMKSNFHLANNLNRILTTTATKIDKDAVADAKTFVEKKIGRESAQSLANVDFNTRSGILLANFMKEMSGTAVADAEVNRLRNILLGGDLTDETYVKTAIASFASELEDQNIELGSTLGDTAPYSVNKYTTKKESATKPSAADFD